MAHFLDISATLRTPAQIVGAQIRQSRSLRKASEDLRQAVREVRTASEALRQRSRAVLGAGLPALRLRREQDGFAAAGMPPVDRWAALWTSAPMIAPIHKRNRRLWTMTKDGRIWRGELQGQGEYGWEFQLYRDGHFRFSHRYDLHAAAVAEADRWRTELDAKGWTPVTAASD